MAPVSYGETKSTSVCPKYLCYGIPSRFCMTWSRFRLVGLLGMMETSALHRRFLWVLADEGVKRVDMNNFIDI